MGERTITEPVPKTGDSKGILPREYKQALLYLGLLAASRDMSSLSEQEVAFVTTRFGIGDEVPKSIRKVVRILQIDPQEVEALETSSLEKLKLDKVKKALFTYAKQDSKKPSMEIGEIVDVIMDVRKGKPDSFMRVFETYNEQVKAYVRSRIYNEQDADDITQSVFINAFNAFQNDNYSPFPGTPFAAWLLKVVRNEIVSNRRKKHNETETVDIENLLNVLEDRLYSPETSVIDPQTLDQLIAVVKTLSPRQQQVIALRFVKGTTIKETARRLGTSANNVKVNQFKAIQNLRKKMGIESSH